MTSHTPAPPAMLCLLLFYFVWPTCQAQFNAELNQYRATQNSSTITYSRFLGMTERDLIERNPDCSNYQVLKGDVFPLFPAPAKKVFIPSRNTYVAPDDFQLDALIPLLGVPKNHLLKLNPFLSNNSVFRGDTILLDPGRATNRKPAPDPVVGPGRYSPGPVVSGPDIPPHKPQPTPEPDIETAITEYEDKGLGYQRVNYKGHRFSIFEVDPKHLHFDLFNKSDDGRTLYTFQAVEQKLRNRLVFAMNAGMFTETYDPVGLFVQDGRVLSEVNTQKGEGNFFLQPNGIFLVDDKNIPRVITTTDYVKSIKPLPVSKVRLATQSGPMLVINNNYHPVFKKDSDHFNLRNGVGVTKNNLAYFVISEEQVTFYELAELFRNYLKCPNALYLDGVISQVYAPGKAILGNKKARLGTIIAISRP